MASMFRSRWESVLASQNNAGTGPASGGRRRASLRLAVLVAAGAAAVLGLATPALAVANGTPVAEGQYRFAVKLTMTNIPRPDGTHYDSACSAALISSRWIITAGHCFHDPDRNPIGGPVPYATTATVGRADVADPQGHVVNVVRVLQSPTSDVALAQLDKAITDVAPLKLSTQAPVNGEILRLAGWGADNSVTPVPSNHLMTGQVQVSTVAIQTLGVHGYAPSPSTSACPYDSGAPYFLEDGAQAPLLVSVESTGPSCPHSQVETTSRVDVLAGWIYRTIGLHYPG
jgi:secreted trypsin-like serine protease